MAFKILNGQVYILWNRKYNCSLHIKPKPPILSPNWFWSWPVVYKSNLVDAKLKILYSLGRERKISSGWKGRDRQEMTNTWRLMKKPVIRANCVCVEERAKQQETDTLQKIWLNISPCVSWNVLPTSGNRMS